MNFLLENYGNLTFIERREAVCRWLLSRAPFKVEWYECQTLSKGFSHNKIRYANYISQLCFYTGKDGQGKETFNGLNFNKDWVLRDILIQDLVIEIESEDQNFNLLGTLAVCDNLQKLGVEFYVFDHQGRAPHIHVYNIFPSVDNWVEKELLSALFVMKVTPSEYYPFVDKSLFGEQQIALEFSKHFKNGTMNRLIMFHKPEVKPCTAR